MKGIHTGRKAFGMGREVFGEGKGRLRKEEGREGIQRGSLEKGYKEMEALRNERQRKGRKRK